MKKLIILIAALTLSACAVNGEYKAGEFSKRYYCETTTDEGRQAIREMLKARGVELPVDYCAAINLIKPE